MVFWIYNILYAWIFFEHFRIYLYICDNKGSKLQNHIQERFEHMCCIELYIHVRKLSNGFKERQMNPSNLDAFEIINLTWLLNVSFSSNITPRSFIRLDLISTELFILYWYCWNVLSVLLVNETTTHLFTFKWSLFSSHHLDNFFKSFWRATQSSIFLICW